MKDPDDKQTGDMLRAPKASRQARYRANKEAAGYRQVAIWIHQESEKAGAAAAARGEPCDPKPSPTDLVSWVVGWAREKESQK